MVKSSSFTWRKPCQTTDRAGEWRRTAAPDEKTPIEQPSFHCLKPDNDENCLLPLSRCHETVKVFAHTRFRTSLHTDGSWLSISVSFCFVNKAKNKVGVTEQHWQQRFKSILHLAQLLLSSFLPFHNTQKKNCKLQTLLIHTRPACVTLTVSSSLISFLWVL